MTDEIKYTPGPWKAFDGTGLGHFRIRDAKNPIADIVNYKNGPSKAEQEANANLIAAAPEMLAALVALENAASRRDSTMGDPSHLFQVKAELAAAARLAREAIAKARGS